VEAIQLLTDDCPQTGDYVRVDSSEAENLVQGCVEQDDVEAPRLRVVNPKSFFFEIEPISGGDGYPPSTLLSPGEDLEFRASTSDPSPLVIEARLSQRSGWYLVVHMFITMLPGANQFGIQGRHVACITQRLADVSYFTSASESLLVDQNGAAAAESLIQYTRDSEAVRRFITAADDCDFGPAPTWSVEGIRQIGGATSTIMSATDYVANYLAGNSGAQVSFLWDSPVTPEALFPAEKIAFSSYRDGNMDVYVMNPDGSDQRRLTTDSSWDWWPSWSPTRQLIAFYSGRDGASEIYVMNPDGSDPRNLTQNPASDGDDLFGGPPSWSPDGRSIAFYSDRGGQHAFNVYTMNADGSRARRIATGISPVWLSDDRSIAFVCTGNGDSICAVKRDGSNHRELVDIRLDYNQWNRRFALSPDGGSILLSYSEHGNSDVFVVDIDGGSAVNLTESPADDIDPVWSPDGRFIAFASNRDGNWEIYVMNADGTDQRNVTQHPAADRRPGW
jgi:TolB protein